MIRVTTTDLENPTDTQTADIDNNYIVVCAGDHYVDGLVAYSNGTVVLTIKKRAPSDRTDKS